MQYTQTVIINDIEFSKVISHFQNINFVKFLISFQPVRLIKWDGIMNNNKAHFQFWLFFWHDFEVKHSLINLSDSELIFKDIGTKLPLGLIFWEHTHTIIQGNNSVCIKDDIKLNHNNMLLGFLLYPILVAPIFIRKILYKLYFNKRRKNVS